MIIVDKLIVKGVGWVLDKVVQAAEAELDDDGALREALLAAQMRLELGEIDDAEFAEIERDLLVRIRAIAERRGGAISSRELAEGDLRVTGIEASFGGDEADGAAGGARRR